MPAGTLLWFIELGGYADFSPLFRRLGYAVTQATTGRRALALLKQSPPDVIIAEFNFQPDFRDRTSALESLLAGTQAAPFTRVIVFYDPAQSSHLEKLKKRFTGFSALAYPIQEERLERVLTGASPAIDTHGRSP